jgi:exonuclease VII large subunit
MKASETSLISLFSSVKQFTIPIYQRTYDWSKQECKELFEAVLKAGKNKEQKECFKDRKMSMDEYENAMKEYNKKLSETIEELIELETKRVYLLRFTSKNKLLKIEKKRIICLIKDLQEDYMKKRKIETRTFELKMESFNKKLSEIEEKLATLEAKKASKGFGISLKMSEEL